MNRKGHSQNLVARQMGNSNAMRHGANSERVIGARANEIREELVSTYGDEASVLPMLNQVARLMAIVERLAFALESTELITARGRPTYLLVEFRRYSRELDGWFRLLHESLNRHPAGAPALRGEFSDYVALVQAIARGEVVATKVQMDALLALLGLGPRGSTSGVLADEEQRLHSAQIARFTGKRFVRTADGREWKEEGETEAK